VRINHILVDYENDPVKSLALLKDAQFRVTLFLGPHNTKLPIELVLAMQGMGDRARYIVLETPGKNALDFHLAYYLGVLAREDPGGFFHIISKDTGFDPLIKHLKARNVLCARSATIEEMPCFNRPAANGPKAPSAEAQPEPLGHQPVPISELVKITVSDLISRKASKPRTPKTLRSTMQATIQTKCGKHIPAADIDKAYETLLRQGYVALNGEKVTYLLPAA
jgi:hypothetical protein